ncbi:MAG: transmembrane 220 family protein [Candidatus Hydrogenedentes bacterium]|nr:transmembrane 220 family protein [Candidatus Hydrogenedentota bacterium]
MRIVSIIMFILLLLCVAVQYNDPDGWIWALIYAYGAAVTWPAIRGRYTVWALIGAIGYFAGAIYWTPKEMVEHPENLLLDLRMHEKGVEEVREDIGLYIAAVWMTVLSVMWWLNRNKAGVTHEPKIDEAAGKAE